jgi:hypothetical protein
MRRALAGRSLRRCRYCSWSFLFLRNYLRQNEKSYKEAVAACLKAVLELLHGVIKENYDKLLIFVRTKYVYERDSSGHRLVLVDCKLTTECEAGRTR